MTIAPCCSDCYRCITPVTQLDERVEVLLGSRGYIQAMRHNADFVVSSCATSVKLADCLPKGMTGRRYVGEKHKVAANLRWADPAFHARQSALAKARWADPDFRKKMMARLSDPKSRAKLSAAAKRRWAQPAARQRLMRSLKASHAAPETREKHSLVSKARWADPTMRAKMIAGIRAVRGKKVLE